MYLLREIPAIALFCHFTFASPDLIGAHEKRDDKPAVVNIGALSEYEKTITDGPTPTGKDVALYPTDIKSIPSKGAEFRMGPEIPGLIDEAWKKHCSQPSADECVRAIDDILNNQPDIAPRQVIAGAGAVVALAGAIVIGHKKLEPAKPIPVDIHLPSPVLSSLESASAATEVVFKTADDDKNAITAAVAATNTDASNGPLKTLDADENGHHKGDIEIDLPENQVKALQDFLEKQTCDKPETKRDVLLSKRVDPVVECLRDETTNTLEAIFGPQLRGLGDTAMQLRGENRLPNFPDPTNAAALTQVIIGRGNHYRANNGARARQIGGASLFAFMIQLAQRNGVRIAVRIILDAATANFDKPWTPVCPKEGDQFYPRCESLACLGKNGKCTHDYLAPCACRERRTDCPTKDKMPKCGDCAPQGGYCTKGDNQDCRCVEDGGNIPYQTDDRPWLDTQHQIFIELGQNGPDSDTDGGAADCAKSKDSKVQNRLFNDGRGATLYKDFCDAVKKDAKTALKQTVDASGQVVPPKHKRWFSRIMKRTPPPDPEAETKAGYTFELEWEGGDGSCNSDCNTFFDNIFASPCAKKGPEQNNMALSATIDTGCGRYTYTINEPPADDQKPKASKPTPGPIVCRAGSYWQDNKSKSFKDLYKSNKCWNDVHAKSVDRCIDNIGMIIPNGNNGHVVDSKMKNVTKFYRDGKDKSGVTYMANIGWIPGCKDFKTQVADNPTGKSGDPPSVSISCTDIIKRTYEKCFEDNSGTGGYQDYGCLRYSFYASSDASIWHNLDTSPYWDNGGHVCAVKDCGDCDKVDGIRYHSDT